MSYLNLFVHCVWSTKKREPFLTNSKTRNKIWTHIRINAKEKGIKIINVNGYIDHCHVLINLKAEQSIVRVIKLIKGESSYWINEKHLTDEPFKWQRKFYAASVSKKELHKVYQYIEHQEVIHAKRLLTFEKEMLFQMGSN